MKRAATCPTCPTRRAEPNWSLIRSRRLWWSSPPAQHDVLGSLANRAERTLDLTTTRVNPNGLSKDICPGSPSKFLTTHSISNWPVPFACWRQSTSYPPPFAAFHQHSSKLQTPPLPFTRHDLQKFRLNISTAPPAGRIAHTSAAASPEYTCHLPITNPVLAP